MESMFSSGKVTKRIETDCDELVFSWEETREAQVSTLPQGEAFTDLNRWKNGIFYTVIASLCPLFLDRLPTEVQEDFNPQLIRRYVTELNDLSRAIAEAVAAGQRADVTRLQLQVGESLGRDWEERLSP